MIADYEFQQLVATYRLLARGSLSVSDMVILCAMRYLKPGLCAQYPHKVGAVSSASLASSINKLKRAGYCYVSHIDQGTSRKHYYSLTPKGEKLLTDHFS